jgi:hypothetical protein
MKGAVSEFAGRAGTARRSEPKAGGNAIGNPLRGGTTGCSGGVAPRWTARPNSTASPFRDLRLKTKQSCHGHEDIFLKKSPFSQFQALVAAERPLGVRAIPTPIAIVPVVTAKCNIILNLFTSALWSGLGITDL